MRETVCFLSLAVDLFVYLQVVNMSNDKMQTRAMSADQAQSQQTQHHTQNVSQQLQHHEVPQGQSLSTADPDETIPMTIYNSQQSSSQQQYVSSTPQATRPMVPTSTPPSSGPPHFTGSVISPRPQNYPGVMSQYQQSPRQPMSQYQQSPRQPMSQY